MHNNHNYGLSVDIGTTHITMHLIRLSDLHIMHEFITVNPQIQFGADIISRVAVALCSREDSLKLSTIVRAAIQDGVSTLLTQLHLNSSDVKQIVVVGNSVMHHLFYDLSVSSLARAPYTVDEKNSICLPAAEIGLTNVGDAECYSPPLIESFIGADASAVILASGLLNSAGPGITIDVGTNTEIAVKSLEGIWIASAASGPAFEGMSMECGMIGETGAISRVQINEKTLSPELEIIGRQKPTGVCGTGAISALAAMLDANIILPRGSFNRNLKSKWLSLDGSIAFYILADSRFSSTGKSIIISQPDVRKLQQSKAAIRGVLDLLLHEAGLKTNQVETLYLTGVFGSGLDMKDAYRIGMFPKFPNAFIAQQSGGAIVGADLLMTSEYRRKVEDLVSSIIYVEMAGNPSFKSRYLLSLPFPDQ